MVSSEDSTTITNVDDTNINMAAHIKRRSIVVQKFGGTSVGRGDRLLNVAKIVSDTLRHENTIVVLSAMSGIGKTEGTTTQLLEAANLATSDCKDFTRVLRKIEIQHIIAIEQCMDADSGLPLQQEIQDEFGELQAFLSAIQTIGEVSARSRDVVISIGERLSAKIFTALLKNMGIPSVFIDLQRVLGLKIHSNRPQLNAEFYKMLREKIWERISSECAKEDEAWRVPVVTGFFGFVPGGILEVVGRGYTDFTAALIAARVRARELQIWKEVDGIFTADPCKVPNALVLPRITPDEAAQLTFYGSEVIHPFSMEQVVRENVPIRIKNAFKPEIPGTLIDPQAMLCSSTTFTSENGDISSGAAVAVTVKRDITVINLRSNQKLASPGFFALVFSTLEKHHLSIDMVSTSQVDISITLARTVDLEHALNVLETIGEVTVFRDMAIVSLVGRRMKRALGIAGQMFSVLALHGVNIEMISQGASEINIGCVINSEHADRAVKALHDEVILTPYGNMAESCNSNVILSTN